MKISLYHAISSALLGGLLAVSSPAAAQDLTLTDGSQTTTIDLQNSSATTGDYVTDLSTDLNVDAALRNQFAAGTAGWVVNLADGVAFISAQTADPSVNIYGAFLNTDAGSTSDPFSLTATSSFSPVSYPSSSPATTFASFHAGLSDSGLEGTDASSPGASAQIALQGYLNNSATTATQGLGFDYQSTTDTLGGLQSGTLYNNSGQSFAPEVYNGPYDQLEALVTGNYSYGAIVTFNGVITVNDFTTAPEPSSWVLFLASAGLATLVWRWRRLAA